MRTKCTHADIILSVKYSGQKTFSHGGESNVERAGYDARRYGAHGGRRNPGGNAFFRSVSQASTIAFKVIYASF